MKVSTLMWIFKKTTEILAVKQLSRMTPRLNNLFKIMKALTSLTQSYLKNS
jgi:hypothetical protein